MRRHMFQCLWRHVKQKRPYNAATAFQVQENVSYQIKRNSSHGVAPAKSSISGQLNLDKQHLEVSSQSWPQSLKLSYVWLRDHCRCYKCYNHTTNQRSLDLLDIPPDIQPESSSIKDNELEIRWMDGHVSRYLLHWLWDNTYNQYVAARTHDYQLWSKESKEIKKIAQEDVDHFMATEKGLFDVVKSLVDFGVGFVTNVPATVNATEMVVKRIAHVQQTMFGGMWEFSDRYAHYDTAYTHQALGAHNDNTYFTEAAGLQVFHCLHHDGEGGENVLVDGFRAAYDLKKSNPESFDRLSTQAIESEYIEPGRHYFSVEPMLKLHPITKKLHQIRFNLYDRAPMKTIPNDQMLQLYDDLRLLAKKVRDPSGEWWIKLTPGTVLFIDNWRVLHGRASYTGLRKMTGCYIGRADFLSKAKVLGVIS